MSVVLPRAGQLARVAALASLLMAAGGAARADDVVRSFSSGTGVGSVGITFNAEAEDKEEDAPQALAASPDGMLFLLDQVNGRILKFDPKQPTAPLQTLQLPPDIEPTDLVVRGNDIYVWDGKAHALQPLGPADAPVRGLTETRSGEPLDDATRSAFAAMGSELIADDGSTRGISSPKVDYGRQVVVTRARGSVTVDIVPTDKGAGAELDVREKDQPRPVAKLHVKVADRLGAVAFLEIDRDDRMYVLVENIPTSTDERASAYVARYSGTGALEGVYELPLAQTLTVSRRFVTVSPDGDVYFLRTQKTGVDVVGLGFRALTNAKTIEVGKPQPNYVAVALSHMSRLNMAVGPLTRQKVIALAYAYEGVQWTLSERNYGPDPDTHCSGFESRIRRPWYLQGKVNQVVKSVPYCWGCQGSLAQFLARVQSGMLAGNICTKNNVRSDVAGLDCSSFVSATWGLSSHFATSAIPAITKKVENPWDMLPGDAFDKPGSHVMLFLGFTPDRKAKVMEESTGGCNGKVCVNIYPLSSLLARGYLPLRYRGLLEANDVPADLSAQAKPAPAEPAPQKPTKKR